MADRETEEEMTDELTAKLIHFHDVTQIDDLERCKMILRQHDWNMERAVQSTLADTVRDVPPVPEPVNHHIPMPDMPHVGIGTRQRIPSPPRAIVHHNVVPRQMIYIGGRRRRPPQGFLGWGFFLLVSPIRYTFNKFYNILKFVFRLFFPDPREMVTDPRGDVRSFISEFEEKYPNHPVFFQGTYGEAQTEAKNQLRFLLIYLHDPGNKDTEPFCHGALCHPESIPYINRNMIFWGCSIEKPEGYRVTKILRNPTYPLLAMVCLYQNRMTVVGRLEGHLTSEELIGRLSEIVEAYEASLISARADRDARSQTQIIRREQDEAYSISLQKDKEKMDKKLREEEEAQKIKEMKEQVKRDKELAVEMCLQRKTKCKEEMPDEPDANVEEIMDLVIKLPNGKRLQRRFHSEDTVKTLHDYVYAHEDSPPRFQVFSNFPRRPIPGCCTNSVGDEGGDLPLLKDAGLNRSDTLFVQGIDNDDDTDSESDTSGNSTS